YIVLTPATGVSNIQYLKDGAFVDMPATLNVLKGDMVTFKAIPSPTASTFYAFDPTWSGTSGATGTGDTTTPVPFNTVSRNSHDYKTVVATVQSGGGSTVNVIVSGGVQLDLSDQIYCVTIFKDNPNNVGGKRGCPDKNSTCT